MKDIMDFRIAYESRHLIRYASERPTYALKNDSGAKNRNSFLLKNERAQKIAVYMDIWTPD